MSIFMFLLLPLMLVLYCLCYRENKNFPLVCIGIMSAVIVCAIRMIFFYPHRVVPYSFVGNLFYFLIKECFLPAAILYVVFCLVSKDTMEYKVNGIFPLEISFYLVYFPYAVINSSSGFMEPFSLILKPIIYVAMFATVGIFAKEMLKLVREKRKIWLVVILAVLILAYMTGPAIIESIYLMNTKFWMAVIFTLCYVAFPFVWAVLRVFRIIKGNYGCRTSYSSISSSSSGSASSGYSSDDSSYTSFFDKYKFDTTDK